MGTTIGEQGDDLYIWTWGYLVGSSEGVGMGIETRGIEIRGCVIMGGEVGGVDGNTHRAGKGDGRAMVSLHCPNRLWRSVIALSRALKVAAVVSVIVHVSMYMACMMRSYGVIECCGM